MLNGYIKTIFTLKDLSKIDEFFSPEFSYTLTSDKDSKTTKEVSITIYDILEEGNRICAIFELDGQHQFVLLHTENGKFTEAWTTSSAIFPKNFKPKK